MLQDLTDALIQEIPINVIKNIRKNAHRSLGVCIGVQGPHSVKLDVSVLPFIFVTTLNLTLIGLMILVFTDHAT